MINSNSHDLAAVSTTGLLAKANAESSRSPLPIGFMRDPSRVVLKDPDMAVQERAGAGVRDIPEVRTVAKVMRVLNDRGLDLPRVIGMAICVGHGRRSYPWRRS